MQIQGLRGGCNRLQTTKTTKPLDSDLKWEGLGCIGYFLAEKELGAPNFPWNSHFLFFYSEFTHIQDSVES
jgi:hypothetical protein